MPNWVFTNLTVSGKTEDLLAFAEKASQQHETQWLTKSWRFDEKLGKNVAVPESERKIEIELSGESPLSFWNFVHPTDEELPYYFEQITKPEDVHKPDATFEERMEKSLKFEGAGWYDWNIRNWGTKWDACSASLSPELDTLKAGSTEQLLYYFETAWSIPTQVFEAMVKQHPELTFDFECEEEQGWGASYTSSDGDTEDERSLIETASWDIPQSHADYVDRGKECWACESSDNSDDLYDDCPKKEQDFYVVITKTYLVRTHTAENAWELAQENDPDQQMTLIEDETSLWVRDENGERLYPTLDNGEDLV